MARPRTDKVLVDEIKEYVENDERASAGEISIHLRGWAQSADFKGALPSERQIARIKKKYLEDDPKSLERIHRRYFMWPESMEKKYLPWEASQACLECLRFFKDHVMRRASDTAREPTEWLTTNRVWWFWRITQAAPDAPVADRFRMAEWHDKIRPQLDEYHQDKVLRNWEDALTWGSDLGRMPIKIRSGAGLEGPVNDVFKHFEDSQKTS